MSNKTDELQIVNEVVNSDELTTLIQSEMVKTEEDTSEIKEFLTNGLTQLFLKEKQKAETIQNLFTSVINVEDIKKSTITTLESYGNSNNSPLNETLKNINNKMGEISPLISKGKDILEGGQGFLGKMKNLVLGKSQSELLKSTFGGLSGKIEAFQEIINEEKRINLLDQENLSKVIPDLGVNIVKIEGLAKGIEVALEKMPLDDSNKELLTNFRDELLYSSGYLRNSLSQLIQLSKINAESLRIIYQTENELILRLNPIVVGLFVGSNNKKIRESRKIVSESLDKLEGKILEDIKTNLDLNLQEKIRIKDTLTNVLVKMNELNTLTTTHQLNINKVQEEINNYLPEYKNTLSQLGEKLIK